MLPRFVLTVLAILVAIGQARGQTADPAAENTTDAAWRRAGGEPARTPAPSTAGTPAAATRRLNPPRDRLRGVPLRAAGHPQRQQPDAAGLPYARHAVRGGRPG